MLALQPKSYLTETNFPYSTVGIMEGKRIEIDGIVYNLEDPEQRKAAVKVWLEAKARERKGEAKVAGEGKAAPLDEEKNPRDIA